MISLFICLLDCSFIDEFLLLAFGVKFEGVAEDVEAFLETGSSKGELSCCRAVPSSKPLLVVGAISI